MKKRRKPNGKSKQNPPQNNPEKSNSTGSDDTAPPGNPPEADLPKPNQPPVKSDRLVSAELWERVHVEFYSGKREEISRRVRVLEPDLWRAVQNKKDEIIQAAGCFDTYEERIDLASCYLENTCFILIETLRRAYYELWRGTTVGTKLELLNVLEKPQNKTENPSPDSNADNF